MQCDNNKFVEKVLYSNLIYICINIICVVSILYVILPCTYITLRERKCNRQRFVSVMEFRENSRLGCLRIKFPPNRVPFPLANVSCKAFQGGQFLLVQLRNKGFRLSTLIVVNFDQLFLFFFLFPPFKKVKTIRYSSVLLICLVSKARKENLLKRKGKTFFSSQNEKVQLHLISHFSHLSFRSNNYSN